MGKVKTITFQVDYDFHKQVKIRATNVGKTMKEYIIELLEKDLKK